MIVEALVLAFVAVLHEQDEEGEEEGWQIEEERGGHGCIGVLCAADESKHMGCGFRWPPGNTTST